METRIKSLDSFKALAAFMVIFLHYGVSNAEIFDAFFRVAVPFFFAVSGYFTYSYDAEKIESKCKRNMMKNLKIYVCFLGFLLLKSTASIVLKGSGFQRLFEQLLSWEFLLFNFNYASYLWFIRALLYTYIFYYLMIRLIKKEKCENILFVLMITTIIIGVLVCKYSLSLGIVISPDVYEIPYKFCVNSFGAFSLGFFLKKYEKRVLDFWQGYKLILLICGSVLLQLLEYYCLEYYNVNNPRCDYYATFILVFVIMVILIKVPSFSPCRINLLGRDYSMWIYLLHMSLQGIVNRLVVKCGTGSFIDLLKVGIAYVVCIGVVWSGSHIFRSFVYIWKGKIKGCLRK